MEKDNVTTFEVRVSIENPGGELKANMSANAEVILRREEGRAAGAGSAVIYDRTAKASVEIPDPKARKGQKKIDREGRASPTE